ncbi:type II secretion system F family protein [Microbacterium indicum]|uniref:type II secretion system F family protein n=1 Tax=Microbacterium indicum TaxID=358100 RepID=UPI0004098824|nr:type II secretion system F family protein [Microbacterium indicum]
MGGLTQGPAEAGDPAGTVLPLAVLLQGGASPAAAWRHLAGTGDAVAVRVAERQDGGATLVEAIARESDAGEAAWGDVAAAWAVAETVGAPLADTLRSVAASLRDAGELRDDVAVALAEPLASARLMMWLPLLGVVVGVGLGMDPLGVLFTTPVGIACLVGGLGLTLAARAWTRRLVRAAQPAPGTPGMHEELLAVALSGGVSIRRAREVLAACAEWSGAASRTTGESQRVLDLSRAAGVPAVELLRASAAHARHRARTDGRTRGAKLGTRLLLPMAVCTLPAFLLLGVAPLLLSVLTSTPIPAFAAPAGP